jgi:hypothetical protein
MLNFGAVASQKQILCPSRDFTFSHSQGHSRPGRTGNESGHVRCAAESDKQVARMSAVICGSRGNDEGSGCHYAQAGYALMPLRSWN